MILDHEDFSAIERSLGPEKAAPIISAFEKLEREQKVEIKKDLLLALATKEDITRLEGATKEGIARLEGVTRADITRLEGATRTEIARLEGKLDRVEAELKVLLKVLIGLVIVAISLFSPLGAELIKLIK